MNKASGLNYVGANGTGIEYPQGRNVVELLTRHQSEDKGRRGQSR